MNTRKLVWSVVALTVVSVLFTVWFIMNFEQRPYRIHVGEEAEALRNPLLAFERFLQQMGRPVKVDNDVRIFDALPADGVLILTDGRRQVLTPARTAALMAWVKSGGHLVMAVSYEGTALQKQLGVTRRFAPVVKTPVGGTKVRPDDDEDDPDNDAAAPPVTKPAPKAAPKAATARKRSPWVDFKSGDDFLRVHMTLASGLAFSKTAQPQWQAVNDAGTQIAFLPIGRGGVTVLNDLLTVAGNDHIAEDDNAEILWLLVNQMHAKGPLILMREPHIVTLWEWLFGAGRFLLASLAALLLIWLWSIIPRLGPMRPEVRVERRGLVEHLRAMGRAVWRVRGGEGLQYWLSSVRQAVLARAAVRDAGLGRKPVAAQIQQLAARMGPRLDVPPQQLADALSGNTGAARPGSSAERNAYTAAVGLMQRIEQAL